MEFLELRPVKEGWSGDRKYHAFGNDGKEYFLRVSPLEKEERVKLAFALQQKALELGIPVSKPGAWKIEGDKIFTWEDWLPGEDASKVLPTLSGKQQNHYGQEAGHYLQLLHTLLAQEGQEDWATLYNRKIDRKIAAYHACPIQYKNDQAFLEYLASHRFLLKNRPQCIQHGDYHVGNMMFCNGKLFIIDFDRHDIGDPWEEFNRIVWCAQLSPAFASGMVQGYFRGEPPLEFWKLLALYIVCNTLASLPWAVPFGKKEIITMQNQARQVLEWYHHMENPIPSWYSPLETE